MQLQTANGFNLYVIQSNGAVITGVTVQWETSVPGNNYIAVVLTYTVTAVNVFGGLRAFCVKIEVQSDACNATIARDCRGMARPYLGYVLT